MRAAGCVRRRIGGGVTAVATYLAAARTALLSGDAESARRQLGATVRHYFDVPPVAFPWLAAQAALGLGAVSLALDDLGAARARLDDARSHVARLSSPGRLHTDLEGLAEAVIGVGSRTSTPSAMALSAAEERVLRLLPTHLSLGEIGEDLHISHNTVKTHVAAIYRKLSANSRAQAVRRARQLGLLTR